MYVYVYAMGSLHDVDRLGLLVTQHEVAGWLAEGLGWLSWAWRRLTEARRPEPTPCPDSAIYFDSHEVQPSEGKWEGQDIERWWWW